MASNDSTTAQHALIPEVIGEVDVGALQKMLQEKCGASVVQVDASRMLTRETFVFGSMLTVCRTGGIIPASDSFPQVITVDFAPLPESPADQRAEVLQEHGKSGLACIAYVWS